MSYRNPPRRASASRPSTNTGVNPSRRHYPCLRSERSSSAWIGGFASISRRRGRPGGEEVPEGDVGTGRGLMDVKAGMILEDRGVWVEGDRIKEVGPIADVRKQRHEMWSQLIWVTRRSCPA